MLLAESVRELHIVRSRRKLRVNAGKSRVMVFEMKEVEMVDFRKLNRVSVPVDERCEISLEDERMEVVKEM